MSEINPNITATRAAGRVPAPSKTLSRPAEGVEAPQAPSKRLDQVELSDKARLLSKLSELPEVRQTLVDRVRADIESGEYLTSDKLDAAADNLINDLEILG